VARINAVLRRRQPAGPPGAPASQTEIHSFGAFELNLATRSLTRGGQGRLADHWRVLGSEGAGAASAYAAVARQADGTRSRAGVRGLRPVRSTCRFSRLRKIVEEDPSKPRHIQTVWGFGYVFVPDGNLKS
jgi:two-component system phosphate regulon response regulator OmpR